MSLLLYSISLQVMEWLAVLASLFNAKAKAFITGRRQALPYLHSNLKGRHGKLLWVHASSVGEYEQGRPVIEMFKAKYPDFQILVSFYSPSGYEAIKDDEFIDFKCYLPRDCRNNARKFIQMANPDLVFFIKYEFWYFYLDELAKNNVPVFSISAIFRPTQVFFKWYGGLFRKMLQKFRFFFVQDEASKELLKSIGIDALTTGDTRLDRVMAISEEEVSLPIIENFIGNDKVFIIGSMRQEDITLVVDFIRKTPKYKFIVAPHEITEEMMRPLEKEFICQRYTHPNQAIDNPKVLIIDTIGILSKLYRFGQYAYVGGGFSDGIHNILEPAVYQLPVFFGNLDYSRFKEAIDLTGLGVAFAVGSASEMKQIHEEIENSKERQEEIQNGIMAYLNQNKGASGRIIEYLDNFIV